MQGRHQITGNFDPFILLQIEVMLCAAVVAWCLIGLLIWLELYGDRKPRHHFAAFFVTIFCGPAAWIVSMWTVCHRTRVVTPVKVASKEPWVMPKDRWN